jgi:Fe-S cluster assembly protein SufD
MTENADPTGLFGALEAVGAGSGSEPAFLGNLRGRAAVRFAELGFPTPRLEEWRFTNVKRIAETPYTLGAKIAEAPDVEPWIIPGAHLLVLVDGRFDPGLSVLEDLPGGVVLTGLREVLERSPELVAPHMEGSVETGVDSAFAMLNAALFADGVFLWLPTGLSIDRPIQLLCVTSSVDRPTANLPRNLIVLGASAEATVVETHAGSDGPKLTSPITDISIGPNARLSHQIVHRDGADTRHVAGRRISVERDAVYSSHTVNLDGELVRTDIAATLIGQGAHVALNGLYLTDHSRHVDNHLVVRHATPHCTSEQLYKGILDGSSKAVFNGRIVVDPDAQKTNAEQSNRNLLLSDRALVHSNPQLEIFADDVRCTHGSTVGRLDEDALFYLRSRGIDRVAAESLLTYAFAADVVQRIGVDEVRSDLEKILFARLPNGELIREAV